MTPEQLHMSHAEQSGHAWMETIREHVACLNADRGWLKELRRMRDSLEVCETLNKDDAKWLAELEEAVKIDGDELDEEEIRERIEESPLSVLVRSGWHSPGEEAEPEEFEILLSTGGPALRIIGSLDQYRQPSIARLEHQDWGTPWTELHGLTSEDDDILLQWAQQFYFGE